MKTSHFWLFLFLTVLLTHGCGGEAQRTSQERIIRVYPPPALTLEIPEPEPPPVPVQGAGKGDGGRGSDLLVRNVPVDFKGSLLAGRSG